MIRIYALILALIFASQVNAQILVCHGCSSGSCSSGSCASGGCANGSCSPGYSRIVYGQPTNRPVYNQSVVIGPPLRLYLDDVAGGERYRTYFHARFDNGESLRLPAINGIVPAVTPVFKNGRISECYLNYGVNSKPLAEVKFQNDGMVWYTSTTIKSNTQPVRAVGGFNTVPAQTPHRSPLLGPSGLKAPEFETTPQPSGAGLKAPEATKVNVNPDSEIERNFKEINNINSFLTKPSAIFNGDLNRGIPRY